MKRRLLTCFLTLMALAAVISGADVYSQSPLFISTGSPVTVGEGSGHLVLADINRDGHLDLVSQHLQRHMVAVQLGDGTGRFTAAPGSPITLDYSPGDIEVGDVNKDGLLDLGVTSSERDAVDIFLGQGSGRFNPAPGSPFLVSPSPEFNTHGLQFVDINEDGKLDIITTSNTRNSFSTLLGNGRGGFSQGPTSTFPAREGRYAFAFGDLDADGHLDAAISNGGTELLAESARVVVLRGNGKGAFENISETPVPAGPRYAALGDINGDGRPDIVLTHGSDQLSVVLNKGGGRFAPASPFDLETTVFAVAVADVNRDKKNDLVVAAVESVIVLLNSASGFAPAPGSPFNAGPGAFHLTTGDINKDGKLDVAASSFGGRNVTVLLGR